MKQRLPFFQQVYRCEVMLAEAIEIQLDQQVHKVGKRENEGVGWEKTTKRSACQTKELGFIYQQGKHQEVLSEERFKDNQTCLSTGKEQEKMLKAEKLGGY